MSNAEFNYIGRCKRKFKKRLASGEALRRVRVVLPQDDPPAVKGVYLVQQRLWDMARAGEFPMEDYPWRKLVACLMLNLTTWTQVNRVIWEFFRRWPDPDSCAAADEPEMRKLITSLGLENKRAPGLIRFSAEYGTGLWDDPAALHGVGVYAWHSWRIFIGRDFSFVPSDGKLTEYVRLVNAANKAGGGEYVIDADGSQSGVRSEEVSCSGSQGQRGEAEEATEGRADIRQGSQAVQV